jgi:penicillin-binding protein
LPKRRSKSAREAFARQLQKIGFRQTPPFDIIMTPSQYANKESIETEIQLADSGYGQANCS